MTAALTRLPAGPGPAPVGEVARRMLDWVIGWWEDHAADENPPTTLPARRYLAGGAPREVAWDLQAGQVTVAVERLLPALNPTAPPGAARSPRQAPGNIGLVTRTVSLEVQIVRCIPIPAFGVASAADLDAHGARLVADAGNLLTCIVDATRSGALLREHVGQAGVVIGDLLTLGPSGGAAAVALPIAIPLL